MKKISAQFDINEIPFGTKDLVAFAKEEILKLLIPQLEAIIDQEYHEVSIYEAKGYKGNRVYLQLYVLTDVDYSSIRQSMHNINRVTT